MRSYTLFIVLKSMTRSQTLFRKLGAVRDGDKPYPALVEHLERQIPDLRLRDDIEHRAYLIGDDKLSLGREGAGYAKARISPPDSSAG